MRLDNWRFFILNALRFKSMFSIRNFGCLWASARICAVVCAFALSFLSAAPASGAHFEFVGKIEPHDPVSHLLAYYVYRFNPEELLLRIDEQPDDSGRIRDLYMNLTGVRVGGVRVENLVFRMNAAQFNPPSEWASGNIELKDVLVIHVYCLLKEDDVNQRLEAATFGRGGDHWSNLSMRITPDGLRAQGTYSATILFVALNILIEIDSGLRIVDSRSIWLDDYQLRVNRLDVPGYITRRAVDQIQPLLDLGRFPFPLRLHNINLENGRAEFSSRTLPTPFQGGITYHYRAE